MRTFLVILLAFLSSCLFNTLAFGLSDRCIDIEQKSSLDLNEAECYVLEQVEKGEVAHFRVSDEWEADYEERFTKIEDRTLSADFLKMLLTGNLAGLKGPKENVEIMDARVSETLNLVGVELPFALSLERCQFLKDVYFLKTTFSGEAQFNSSTFSEGADF